MGWTRRNAGVSVLLVMDEHRKQAGQRLAQIRDSKGLSQEDLAQRANLSVKTVSRFENGRHDGRRSTVRQIAEALDVSEADILGPPPDPLGLTGPTQLDRIEAKLDELLSALRQREAASIPPPPGKLGRVAQGSEPTPQPREQRRSGRGKDAQRGTG